MHNKSQTRKLLSLFLYTTILLSIIQITSCMRNQHTPRGMDYELRRPITYLYNRLAQKFDFNPYTSHLLNTDYECSSRTGPYCGFINGRRLMEGGQMLLSPEVQQIHKTLLLAAQGNRQAARQIQRGELDAFLISGEYNKKFDQAVKIYIEKDFYEAVPTHKRLYPSNKNLQNKRK